MNKISGQVRIGAIGELLVQLRFLQYDVQAAPPLKDSGNDLIAIRGEQWRAIQVKTTQTREGRCVFDLRKLPLLYHLLAIVRLEGDERNVYLDRSSVYFLEKHEINKGYYTFEELAHRELSGKLIDQLFPRPEAAPAGSA
jgi:hypothetical protein